MIIRNKTVYFTPSPEELAGEFANLFADEQARFFNALAVITKGWTKPFVSQMQFVVDSAELTPDGKNIMRDIGDYGSEAT